MNATIEFLEDTELEVIAESMAANGLIDDIHNEVFRKGELIDVDIIELEPDCPNYVNLQFEDGSLAGSVERVCFKEVTKTLTCSICHKPCDQSTAHLHQDDWIGDCCWDDRLKASE